MIRISIIHTLIIMVIVYQPLDILEVCRVIEVITVVN
jgi:hypothetical protein